MQAPVALFSDFDGTISDDDFFWFLARRYFDETALEPWNRYLRGEMTHLESLNAIFAQVHLPEAEFLAFIDTIRIDPTFKTTLEVCRQKKIPVYIGSAGCDYYINRLVGPLIDQYHICLITNHGVYNPQEGLKMIPPYDSPFYDPKVGVSKANVVEMLKSEGYQVVLAGDGPPDFPAAVLADVVFAKKILLEKCLKANIKTQPFSNFEDISAYLREV